MYISTGCISSHLSSIIYIIIRNTGRNIYNIWYITLPVFLYFIYRSRLSNCPLLATRVHFNWLAPGRRSGEYKRIFTPWCCLLHARTLYSPLATSGGRYWFIHGFAHGKSTRNQTKCFLLLSLFFPFFFFNKITMASDFNDNLAHGWMRFI